MSRPPKKRGTSTSTSVLLSHQEQLFKSLGTNVKTEFADDGDTLIARDITESQLFLTQSK